MLVTVQVQPLQVLRRILLEILSGKVNDYAYWQLVTDGWHLTIMKDGILHVLDLLAFIGFLNVLIAK